MGKYEYITEEFVAQTNYKSLIDGYDRDYFSIVKSECSIAIHMRTCPTRTANLLFKEVKRIYPGLHIVY